MHILRKAIYLLCILFLSMRISSGQEILIKPVSFRVFTPFIFNPAITGSRDYSSVDLITAFQGESNAQLISAETRMTGIQPGYFSSGDMITYKNTATGTYVFREKNANFTNSGVAATVAYHIPLNKKSLSFLSFGVAFKGYFSSANRAPFTTSGPEFYPGMDLGAYYYGQHLFTGFSATNVFGEPKNGDNPEAFKIPVSRQFYFHAGYKILILRSLDIIFEPSIISIFDTLNVSKAGENIRPVLKLYLQNFCLGTYFHDHEKNTFFFQYRYPKFYIGGYIALPKKSPYYPKDVIVEITAGVNFSKDKRRFAGHGHW